ncbi:MAG: hypothetical protein JJ977_18880 [Kordiimonadaceae bacterium]|nr:hypothetical protein [Kordiimonadaceae bacterium]
MTNSREVAEKWTRFISDRSEFSKGDVLLKQFQECERIEPCDCGCNSYSCELPSNAQPIADTTGLAFEISFRTSAPEGTVDLLVHIDKRGNLGGIDVHFNSNSEAMPENPRLIEPPQHVHGPLATGA